MTKLIIIVFVVSIIVLLLIKYLSSPKIYKNIPYSLLSKYLNVLLYRGFDSGFIIISSKNNKKFLQFKKFIINKGNVKLELGFPLVKWTSPYYNKLHALLKRENIKFNITPKSNDYELEFTDINCGMDIDLCLKLVKIIFVELFNYKENELVFNVKFEDVSPEDVKIGF